MGCFWDILKARVIVHMVNSEKMPILSFSLSDQVCKTNLFSEIQTSIKSSKLKRGTQYLAKNVHIQCPFKWHHAWMHTRNSTINFKTQNVLKKYSVL